MPAATKKKQPSKPKKPSAAAIARAALDAEPPRPSDDAVPLIERRRSAVEQARPPPPPLRLLSRREVCERIGVSYPTLWSWMRFGKFPRSRVMNGGKICWLESDIEAWIRGLPVQTLKPADEEPDNREKGK
jgi:predicted DNA-binding transcriptional regulator AlpA